MFGSIGPISVLRTPCKESLAVNICSNEPTIGAADPNNNCVVRKKNSSRICRSYDTPSIKQKRRRAGWSRAKRKKKKGK
jgi:hypothetical protein